MIDSGAVFKRVLARLHDLENELELLTFHKDEPRLMDAEIAIHRAITAVQRASEGKEPDYSGICLTDSYGCRR